MIGNTPMEVAEVLIGSKRLWLDCWVSDDGKTWVAKSICGVIIGDDYTPFLNDETEWQYCSLSAPTPKAKTRTMTALEMVRYFLENQGRLAYQHKDWLDCSWVTFPLIDNLTKSEDFLQARINDPNFPTWESLPEVEES
jgi:hypothetical protein